MQRDGGPGGGGPGGGGPGGGGPVGSSNSFTGPSSALELVGSHCYAYSGLVQSSGAQSSPTDTVIQFSSGNFYSDVIISWANEITSGTADGFIRILMNDAAIYNLQSKEGADANESNPKNLHLIIPSYTDFEMRVGNGGDPANWTVVLAGRIYRG